MAPCKNVSTVYKLPVGGLTIFKLHNRKIGRKTSELCNELDKPNLNKQ